MARLKNNKAAKQALKERLDVAREILKSIQENIDQNLGKDLDTVDWGDVWDSSHLVFMLTDVGSFYGKRRDP